jgi:hypothetical protein
VAPPADALPAGGSRPRRDIFVHDPEGNVRPKTGRGVAAALGIPIEDLLPTAQAELFREPLEHELLEERRAEATGRSAEERVEISNALAESIEHLNSGYGEALEQFAGGAPGAPEEIFSLYVVNAVSRGDARLATTSPDADKPHRVAAVRMAHSGRTQCRSHDAQGIRCVTPLHVPRFCNEL